MRSSMVTLRFLGQGAGGGKGSDSSHGSGLRCVFILRHHKVRVGNVFGNSTRDGSDAHEHLSAELVCFLDVSNLAFKRLTLGGRPACTSIRQRVANKIPCVDGSCPKQLSWYMALDMSDRQTFGEASFESHELMPEVCMSLVRTNTCLRSTQDHVHAIRDNWQRFGGIGQFQCRNSSKELASTDRLFSSRQRTTLRSQEVKHFTCGNSCNSPAHSSQTFVFGVISPRSVRVQHCGLFEAAPITMPKQRLSFRGSGEDRPLHRHNASVPETRSGLGF